MTKPVDAVGMQTVIPTVIGQNAPNVVALTNPERGTDAKTNQKKNPKTNPRRRQKMLSVEQARALARPFAETEIEWRVGQAGKNGQGRPWVKVLAYLTSRAVMERLDEVFGVGGWSHTVREIAIGNTYGIICTLRVRIGDQWCDHEDVSECSDIEALKGAASGALKRAAVHLGIGRYLYYLPEGWGEISDNGSHRHSGKAKDGTALNFRWNPPILPEWAIPAQGDKPYNPYAVPVTNSTPEDEPPATKKPEAKPNPDGIVWPDNIPEDFRKGIMAYLRLPDALSKLKSAYAKACVAAEEIGVKPITGWSADWDVTKAANEVISLKSRILYKSEPSENMETVS